MGSCAFRARSSARTKSRRLAVRLAKSPMGQTSRAGSAGGPLSGRNAAHKRGNTPRPTAMMTEGPCTGSSPPTLPPSPPRTRRPCRPKPCVGQEAHSTCPTDRWLRWRVDGGPALRRPPRPRMPTTPRPPGTHRCGRRSPSPLRERLQRRWSIATSGSEVNLTCADDSVGSTSRLFQKTGEHRGLKGRGLKPKTGLRHATTGEVLLPAQAAAEGPCANSSAGISCSGTSLSAASISAAAAGMPHTAEVSLSCA